VWVSAIRLTYVGVCLTTTPASLWGGTMLRLARRMVGSAPMPDGIPALALEHANPGGEEAARCTALALRFLGVDLGHDLGRDLGRDVALERVPASVRGPSVDGAARELYLLLRPETAAPWLFETVVSARRAAVATPLDERTRFPLFRVLCASCAPSAAPGRGLFEHVGTYDVAIRCPGCLVLHRHPIRAVTIGAPHPVGRCLRDPQDPCLCMVHEVHEAHEGAIGGAPLHVEQVQGGLLDAEGLCPEGRATLTRAQAIVAELGQPVTPADRTLFDAVARARDVVPSPLVAAVAALDPEAAREIEEIPGLGVIRDLAEAIAGGLEAAVQSLMPGGKASGSAAKAKPAPALAKVTKPRKTRKGGR
jgi:hypothetical protein